MAAPFTYSVRAGMQANTARRWITLEVELSQPATVVAILQRRDVPFVAAVFTGRAGANDFVVRVPRRVRPGRYVLKLVLGTATEQHTLVRSLRVPR